MFSEDFCSRFAGVARLYGAEAFEKIVRSRICLIGLGGVGSWTCEALARCGVCNLTLVDMDDVCVTNTNRQLHALSGNYGLPKAKILSGRVCSINPECNVSVHQIFVTRESAALFFEENKGRFDLVVDAIDGAMNKAALIASCVAAKIPIISSGGCAGKRDGTRVEYGDLSDVEGDSLLKFVRKELRVRYGFPKGNSGKKMGVPVVFSREISRLPETLSDAFPQMISPAGGKPRPGTVAFTTGAFGLALAQLAIEQIIRSGN
ncbi:MAG: tRNA threonylcarbamoyladenosine dehydratase [Opitutales bacterium]|nr:tRNA threonylcarbamoyladenosine dehydratase [Opitutales bacterium]